MFFDCVLVGFGGFLGSVCRYLLTLLPYSDRVGFPVITLAINVLGSFVIGILVGVSMRFPGVNNHLITFLRVGFCGGFTTFSTFALEMTGLLRSGRAWACFAYIVLSILLGVGAVFAGKAIVS